LLPKIGKNQIRKLVHSLLAGKNMKSDKTICYCMGVKESTIVKAIHEGAHTLKAIQKATKACTGKQCKELNPKGLCCSADIIAIIKRETGKSSEDKCCCCH